MMIKKDLGIVFMGTPEFATTILDKLYTEGVNIKAVITAPDKPSGRGQKVNMSHVKEYALTKDLPILQPTNLKDEEFISTLRALEADLFVVVAFRMLPEVVWSMPPNGTINLHASLLPNYRGAAPINWAIINGEKETGVSTFFIEKQIDTGEIIDQEKVTIGDNENVGELYGRLMKLGSEVMLRTIYSIAKDEVNPIPQSEMINNNERPAPKIFKQDCEVDFNQAAQEVHNFCRGLSPYPAAWCRLMNTDTEDSKTYKLFTTELTDIKIEKNKSILKDKEGILMPCSDFYIRLIDLQPEGKRKMNFKDFLAGNSIENLVVL